MVWIPILDRDEGTVVPGVSRNVNVTPQYFDGEKLVGLGLARSLGVTQPVWDAFFFYAPGAVWSDQGLPTPEVMVAQVQGVVIANLGVLPPIEDQARLAPALQGKAVVVGEQKNIEDLLARVAEPFVARHRK